MVASLQHILHSSFQQYSTAWLAAASTEVGERDDVVADYGDFSHLDFCKWVIGRFHAGGLVRGALYGEDAHDLQGHFHHTASIAGVPLNGRSWTS